MSEDENDALSSVTIASPYSTLASLVLTEMGQQLYDEFEKLFNFHDETKESPKPDA